MMLFKLSLRNAQRQSRDYLVYFITLVMSSALMYSFNSLVFSEEVLFLAANIASLPAVIIFASIVVIFIIGWLVSYTTRFMLLRRSRELGTYLLIGLENKQTARLFFLENLTVGIFALIAGILSGCFLFQAMRAVILTLFGTPYTLALSLSIRAVLLTVIYYALIYLFAQFKNRKRIHSMKIYDLIYYEKYNEDIVIQTDKKRRRIFTVSIVLGAAGTLMLLTGNPLFGLIGACCIIAFLYGFFLSFASGVPAFFEKRPARKYRGQTLLIFRTLTAKLATIGALMATISLLLTAVIISEGCGQCIHALFRERAKQDCCFDLFISSRGKARDQTFPDYVGENIPVKSSLLYHIYLNDNAQILDYISERTEYYQCFEKDTLMKFSDYATLREMMGYPAVTLPQNACLIHCIPFLSDILQDYDEPITVGDTALTPDGVYTELLSQTWDSGNGHQYILVVPDEVLTDCPSSHEIYAAMTSEPVSEAQFQALSEILPDTANAVSLRAKSIEEAGAASGIVLFVFPLYYLALILTMTAAAILTIQQLAETDRYRRQFSLLGKLGMRRAEMIKVLRGQFVLYYAMPALPPILIGTSFIYYMGNMAEPGTLAGASSPLMIVLGTLALFFFIYAIYIVLAYTSLKRNVLPERT